TCGQRRGGWLGDVGGSGLTAQRWAEFARTGRGRPPPRTAPVGEYRPASRRDPWSPPPGHPADRPSRSPLHPAPAPGPGPPPTTTAPPRPATESRIDWPRRETRPRRRAGWRRPGPGSKTWPNHGGAP